MGEGVELTRAPARGPPTRGRGCRNLIHEVDQVALVKDTGVLPSDKHHPSPTSKSAVSFGETDSSSGQQKEDPSDITL